MRRVLKIAGLILLASAALLAIATIAAFFLSFESEPRFTPSAPPTPEEIARLKRSLERQDPRRLESGEAGTLSLSDRELAIALSQALSMLGLSATVRVELEPERLALRSSVELPTHRRNRFLNVDLVVHETEHLPRFERLRLGKTPVPAWLADSAWRWVLTGLLKGRGGAELIEMVEAVALDEARLEVSYHWQPSTVELVRAGIVDDADRGRLEAYSRELAAFSRKRSSARVPLTELLEQLFDLARRRSGKGESLAENRALILVLGAHVSRRRLDALVPEAAEWPQARKLQPTLRGQYDLAQHFVTSAMVAAVGGSTLSDALGLYKELEDSRGGSGFSFQDLAADRAGARFGELAISSSESASRIQRLLGERPSDSTLLPPVEDLPDALSQAEFEQLVGSVGSPEYQRMTAEIDRRLSASQLYRTR